MKTQNAKQTINKWCWIKFPERIWERMPNGWTSRSPTPEEVTERRKVAESLGAQML